MRNYDMSIIINNFNLAMSVCVNCFKKLFSNFHSTSQLSHNDSTVVSYDQFHCQSNVTQTVSKLLLCISSHLIYQPFCHLHFIPDKIILMNSITLCNNYYIKPISPSLIFDSTTCPAMYLYIIANNKMYVQFNLISSNYLLHCSNKHNSS